jgi:hypothetical protein
MDIGWLAMIGVLVIAALLFLSIAIRQKNGFVKLMGVFLMVIMLFGGFGTYKVLTFTDEFKTNFKDLTKTLKETKASLKKAQAKFEELSSKKEEIKKDIVKKSKNVEKSFIKKFKYIKKQISD